MFAEGALIRACHALVARWPSRLASGPAATGGNQARYAEECHGAGCRNCAVAEVGHRVVDRAGLLVVGGHDLDAIDLREIESGIRVGEGRGGHRHAVAEGDIPNRGPLVGVKERDHQVGSAGPAARAGHGQHSICEVERSTERSEVEIFDGVGGVGAAAPVEAWVLEGQATVVVADPPCTEDPRSGLSRVARAEAGREIVDEGDGGRLRRGTQRSTKE